MKNLSKILHNGFPLRKGILLLVTGILWGAAVALAQDEELTVTWHDLATLPIEGKGWTETRYPYDRLPAAAERTVPEPVWNLSLDSAGLRVRFVTNAQTIQARWVLRKPERFAMPHMPATGASGLDLYIRDAGEWRWLAVGRPMGSGLNEQTLVQGLEPRKREYMLYLPLYNGVSSVMIGVPSDALFEPADDRYTNRKPVVFYGTSITQGGVAARPGMAYPAIIGRELDWPIINLGFSGNGKIEPEMAELLAQLDPAAYVIDSLPNLTPKEVDQRIKPFIKLIRTQHPETPILLVENINYADGNFVAARRSRTYESNSALRKRYEELTKEGDNNLFYVPASHLLGEDGEDTVDGTHPTDLGFLRIAKGMGPIVREALESANYDVPREVGFESLFDGETLSGWTHHTGMPEAHIGGKWWVEDGALTGTQDPPGKGGLLWLDRSFSDFILKLEVKLDYPADSGVFVRVGPDGHSNQITLDYRPGSDIGSIFIPFTGHTYVHRSKEGIRAFRGDDWNDLTIRMEGEPARVQVWLNGYLITDFQHTVETTMAVPESGGIALQIHPDVGNLTVWGEGNKARYRNIRIKDLSKP